MGWSLSYLKSYKPELINSFLLASGKALHLSNLFESKCDFVLRIFKLVSYLDKHPGTSLPDVVASISKEKFLGQKIKRLKKFPEVKQTDVASLEKARDARNFIAHEGASFGYVFSTNEKNIKEQLRKLKNAVSDLIEGDNLISSWVYEIEEKAPAPASFIEIYPDLVGHWVFDDIDKKLRKNRKSEKDSL